MLNEEFVGELEARGIIIDEQKRVPCSGDGCGCIKFKVIQGTPKPPKARAKNTCDEDVELKIEWCNFGCGKTTHTIWAGETVTIDGPTQYWGVKSIEARKL